MLYFIYRWSNCWNYAKLHKGSTEIWMPHPGPEIEFSLFSWSLFSCIFSSWQEVGSLEVGIYYIAWFEKLATAINQETKGSFEQRCSVILSEFELCVTAEIFPAPHFQLDNILIMSAATTSIALQYDVRRAPYVYLFPASQWRTI